LAFIHSGVPAPVRTAVDAESPQDQWEMQALSGDDLAPMVAGAGPLSKHGSRAAIALPTA